MRAAFLFAEKQALPGLRGIRSEFKTNSTSCIRQFSGWEINAPITVAFYNVTCFLTIWPVIGGERFDVKVYAKAY